MKFHVYHLVNVKFYDFRDATTGANEEGSEHKPLFNLSNKSLGILRTKIEGGTTNRKSCL